MTGFAFDYNAVRLRVAPISFVAVTCYASSGELTHRAVLTALRHEREPRHEL